MRAVRHRPRRAGLTLVELVVVIGIIVILLAIGAAFLPGLQGNQKVQNGVDRVAQWLLIAKGRAKHDGLPTGLRFVVDPNNPTMFSQFVYVQQPDYLFGDPGASNVVSAFTDPSPPAGTPSPQVLFTGNPDFIGPDSTNPLVQAGDYLELSGGGTLYAITGVTTSVYSANKQSYVALNLSSSFTGPTLNTNTASFGTTTWRIIRQPRRLAGEDFLTLPQDIVVDLSTMPPSQPPQVPPQVYTWSQNVPQRTVGGTTYYEILFSPTGDVIGQTANSGKVLLWVRDTTVPSPSQGDNPTMQGNPTLVAVQVRGGFLGTYPVLPNTDATQYPQQFYTAALYGRSGF